MGTLGGTLVVAPLDRQVIFQSQLSDDSIRMASKVVAGGQGWGKELLD